jgi:hypothetical protein
VSHFTTQGQRYPDGLGLATFSPLDVNVPPPPAAVTTVDQIAPSQLSDGQTIWAFLFWDTGRQVAGKRHVRWTFSHADQWSTWSAVAWYGVVSGNGPPPPIASFGSYWVGHGAVDPTPIDGPASSFVNGGGAGQIAWPYEGNDHEVRTEWGRATVHALDHVRRSVSDPDLDFSALTKLVYGDGDAGDVFDENDNAATGGTIVGAENVTAQDIGLAQGEAAVVLASYVTSVRRRDFLGDLRKLLTEADLGRLLHPNVDPSPEDLVRLRLIAETLDLVRGERPTPDAFSGLVDAAKVMSQSELKRTIAQTRATLRRGEASLKSMEAIAAKAKSGGR